MLKIGIILFSFAIIVFAAKKENIALENAFQNGATLSSKYGNFNNSNSTFENGVIFDKEGKAICGSVSLSVKGQ